MLSRRTRSAESRLGIPITSGSCGCGNNCLSMAAWTALKDPLSGLGLQPCECFQTVDTAPFNANSDFRNLPAGRNRGSETFQSTSLGLNPATFRGTSLFL